MENIDSLFTVIAIEHVTGRLHDLPITRAPGALGMLGWCYGVAGRRREANKVLNELFAHAKRRYVTPVAMSYIYIGLGDKDQAFTWLEKAYQEQSFFLTFLKATPLSDPVRSDPRFDDLLRRVGLAP